MKETAFSGVFPTVEALRGRGRRRCSVARPDVRRRRARELGFTPYHLGEPVDAAVLQADHAEYRELTPADLPGIRTLVDGRSFMPLERWDGVTVRVLGRG